jgi:hypothetical protein
MNFKFINIILTVLVVVICFIASYGLLIGDMMPDMVGNKRIILGIILVAYGIFRSLRLKKLL